jgi:alanyl-tRNA synthetase
VSPSAGDSITTRLYEEGPPLTAPSQAMFTARVLERGERSGRPAVLLDQTLFFPTGGGQPCDQGALGSAAVLEVIEEGQAVWHLLDAPLDVDPGAEVEGRVDLARRRDHMEQHSGQHLLSAILLARQIPTVAFHLGADEVTIDVRLERLEPELLAEVELEVNAAIREDLPVTATVYEGADAVAQAGSLRAPPAAAALASPRGLRIVQLGHGERVLDRDPCCGTHVSSTGQLGALVLLGSERGRRGETRLRFAVGGRATSAARARLDSLGRTARVLDTGFAELPARAEKLLGLTKTLQRDLRAVRARLIELEAEALARAVQGPALTHLLEGGDAKEAAAFARALLAVRPRAAVAVVHVGERLTLVLARGEAGPDLDAGALLRELLAPLGGKGGGQPAFAQGAAADPSRAPELLAAARRALGLTS